ncbi:MAG: ABC transporter permease subunit [Deltaproteobacteria bacterium]|nr:ABC transporter permease subunit [Deltaproteobacteria bacterium]
MKRWWAQPLVRVLVALALPAAVPALITALIWLLPGDPASIICPPEICGGTDGLAARWNLDRGPVHFYRSWVSGALAGDMGNSWRVLQGVPVRQLLDAAVPNTVLLILLATTPLLLASVAAGVGWLPRRLDPAFQAMGLVPAVVLALVAAAAVLLRYGADAHGDQAAFIRLLLGALVLGVADGALSGAVVGVRGVFDRERTQPYVLVGLLRGEGELGNMLPNVAGSLAGQLRARLLHLLSGAVVVEAVLRIDGLGDLLWRATILQDFGLVLAAATGFAVVSSVLLLLQALVEVVVAWHVRRAPLLPAEVAS